MKYTIEGFSQEIAMSFKKTIQRNGKEVCVKIDCTDLVILRWFVDFYPNMKKIEVDGKQYAWLTHKKLLDDLPLIDISKRSFSDRLQKLVDFGILTYTLIKEGGTFAAYGFGSQYGKLVARPAIEQHEGMQSNSIGVCNQMHNKDNSIIDASNTDKRERAASRFQPPSLDDVKAYCAERNNGIDAERFVDYYSSNGWIVGRSKMKDWKAAVRNWERREKNGGTAGQQHKVGERYQRGGKWYQTDAQGREFCATAPEDEIALPY